MLVGGGVLFFKSSGSGIFSDRVKWAKYIINNAICRDLMASRTNPGCSKVSIVGKVPSRACEAPVGRARVNCSSGRTG